MDAVETLLDTLTVEQKIKMLSGKDFWHTQDYPELGIDSVEVADGPYGLRKQKGLCDHMGWNISEPATAYVSGPGLASSWDRELAMETGKHLAAEARDADVDVLLGPAVNIVRTPLCGRNFEYYSEDPFLASSIASSYISGVQSQGVGTCIKHFAANNQETDREYINVLVDERTLREIYLAAFENAVKEAKPWCIMSALNKVNGAYCSENKWLLTDILRNEWGFEGLVMSDWSGVNNRIRALQAGLDLEMPYSYGVSENRLRQAYEDGSLSIECINEGCRNILKLFQKVEIGRTIVPEYLHADHNLFAREMAERCAVLLKNDRKILPLRRKSNIAVIGRFAKEPRFKMEGSALVNPTRWDIPYEEIKKLCDGTVTYSDGYDCNSILTDKALASAVDCASKADVAIVFAGLPNGIEAEGKDRKNLQMPESHVRLISEIVAVQPNTVVVLLNGSPVDLSWDSQVAGVLEMFLGGQCMGGAVANLLFGLATPGGKLPVTFPYELEQNPSYLNYPGYSGEVKYVEETFVGYRYYESKKIHVRYCFGFGLSYTSFSLAMSEFESSGNSVQFNITVRNIGKLRGSEVVQVYVQPPKGRIPRPTRALKAFRRVYLEPNEEKTISFQLNESDFSYFDMDLHDWYATQGEYFILVGTSSQQIEIEKSITIYPSQTKYEEITGWSTLGTLRSTPAGEAAIEKIKKTLLSCDNHQAKNFPIFQMNGESQEQVDSIPLRMITVLTDNIINNDIMDSIIAESNMKNLEYCR